MDEVIKQYKDTLSRKERLLKPYHDKKKTLEDLTINELTVMLVLEAEIHLIKEFLEDLEHHSIGI